VYEHPELSATARRYEGKPVQFVGVLYNDIADAGARWVSERGGEAYPAVLDPGARSAIDYGLYGVPETFVIDPDGRVAHKFTGAITAAGLGAKIDSILVARAAPAGGAGK
jgi:cytochrome c biogenesis protein CcmG/thiol:disulfide interchange protein DsbE